MIQQAPLHRVPRWPHAAGWAVGALHAGLLLAWWRGPWPLALALTCTVHGILLWGVLRPGSRLFGPVLTRLPLHDRRIWLTIDDGPSDDTEALLDLLDRHGARATFFLVGARATARPHLARAIAERGHGIGNHSQTHPQAWFWALGPRRMRAEVAQCQAALQAITGHAPRWFRSVVGHTNPSVHPALHAHGLARVGWSARGFDAVEADPATVVARIERGLAPGAIVLVHEGAPHGRSVEAVAQLLQRLDALGYATALPEGVEDAGTGGGPRSRLPQ
ncbi:MAG TPA: polysaccharide deacetylase family protein [Luteimonas sp.]|nr:polysaccharide deacetylase family protein [Luteimonas sp.]